MNRQEKNLRERLGKIEEELELLNNTDSKRYKILIQEHREIVNFLGDDPQGINSLEDIKKYNSKSQGRTSKINI